MLSVTGANFTPDNGSVSYTDLTLPMQTRTQGPILSVLGSELHRARQWGFRLLGNVRFVLANFCPGKSVCKYFSAVKNALRARDYSDGGLGVFREECFAFCRTRVRVAGGRVSWVGFRSCFGWIRLASPALPLCAPREDCWVQQARAVGTALRGSFSDNTQRCCGWDSALLNLLLELYGASVVRCWVSL